MPRYLPRAALLALLALGHMGCRTQALPEFPQCRLGVELSVDEGAFDDPIVISGREFSAAYDTVVTIGGLRAPVDVVTREECTFCDLCRQAASNAQECDICETCVQCTTACEPCVQQIQIRVPDAAPGWSDLIVINRFGASPPIPFLVLVAPDTGEPDDTGATSRRR